MKITVALLVTDVYSGKEVRSSGELTIRRNAEGIFVALTSGGPTGFENFFIPTNEAIDVHEWCACLGRKFEYDRVVVPEEEMERAFREAGLIE